MKIFGLFCLLFICLMATQTFAATFTVNQASDAGDLTCDATCTLRDAIDDANATSTNDTITFAIPVGNPNCTLSGICTITMTGSQFQINSATISGTLAITNATGASNLLISGNNGRRVFSVLPGGNLALNGVAVMNGNSGGNEGAGILNDNGTVTITNSIVSGNTTIGAGAGIFNQSGSVTLTNSTVSGNVSTGSYGAGVTNQFGTITLTNSTVSGNTATTSAAGGIFNRGTLTMTNSTVSGNTGLSVGGIINYGTLNLNSVTVTNNRSTTAEGCTPCAGGIANASGAAYLDNTIVAGNITFFVAIAPDFSGEVSFPSSNNIIGNNQGTTGITDGVNGNQVGTPANPIDPRLAGLADNGGATKTHALLFGSPAIDAGNNCVFLGSCPSGVPPFPLLTDQRGAGFTRSADGNGDSIQIVDIGAFEAQTAPAGPTAASVGVGGRVMTASGRGIQNVVVTMTDFEGNIRIARSTSFGYYRFDDVMAGETYVLSARGKRYNFIEHIQVRNINEETSNINFIGYSEKGFK